jgi:hypothetical protein
MDCHLGVVEEEDPGPVLTHPGGRSARNVIFHIERVEHLDVVRNLGERRGFNTIMNSEP